MAVNQDPVIPSNIQRIETGGAARVFVYPIGEAYAAASATGTIAAALASLATMWLMRVATGAGSRIAMIDRIRVQYTCLAAFTTPVTAGRRLALFRGSSSSPATSGGTAVDPNPPKRLDMGASVFDSAGGGDHRIATTAALVTTGVTFEAIPKKIMLLAHVGAAGAFFEEIFDFQEHPLTLRAGEVLALRAGQLFDAAGTWQASVNAEWREGTPMV